MAQWQLLGARKHEGGGEKGMQQGRQGGKKGEAGEEKIWRVTKKKRKIMEFKKKEKQERPRGGRGLWHVLPRPLCSLSDVLGRELLKRRFSE